MSGTASGNRLQYTGLPNDGTGLQYNRARYYDPSLQRFISPDPLGFGGGSLNLYSYVNDSPTNGKDPSGQFAEVAAACVVGAVANVAIDWAGQAMAGRKYTAGQGARDAGLGCLFGVLDPELLAGEGMDLAAGSLASDTLPDDPLVVRGGASEALSSEGSAARAGTHPSGVTGWSAESRAGACLEELCARIPNNQVGVTTAGDIRAAGGDVISTSGRSPNHVTITGINPDDLSELLNPPIRNPVPPAERIR